MNILEFIDFYFPVGIAANSEKDNFTLSEIENGMIVKTENDFMRIRIGDYFYRLEGIPIYIDNSRKDLWVCDIDDICEIYRIDTNKQLSLEQILSVNLTDSHIKVWSKSEGRIE